MGLARFYTFGSKRPLQLVEELTQEVGFLPWGFLIRYDQRPDRIGIEVLVDRIAVLSGTRWTRFQ